ncbi:hypothetical protein C0J56_27550 [Pseudomonas fluorescens]|nr:hypothetical protein C0J56_27550 [Pseudomonas fluorescens]
MIGLDENNLDSFCWLWRPVWFCTEATGLFASKPAPTGVRIPMWERACSRRGLPDTRSLRGAARCLAPPPPTTACDARPAPAR